MSEESLKQRHKTRMQRICAFKIDRSILGSVMLQTAGVYPVRSRDEGLTMEQK